MAFIKNESRIVRYVMNAAANEQSALSNSLIVEIFVRSAALEGSEQPPFQQGNDQVNARKQRLASLPKVLNFSIMDIAIEFPVGVKTIRANHAS